MQRRIEACRDRMETRFPTAVEDAPTLISDALVGAGLWLERKLA
jgi:hypothetical protein